MTKDDEGQLVIFELGEQKYALPILETQEIMRMVSITRMPNTSHFVEGVINLRGNVIPVINLNLRLGLEKKEYNPDTRIIVVNREGQRMGMIVDRVQEVGHYAEAELDLGAITEDNDLLSGVVKKEEQLWLLLNLNKIF